MQKGKEEKDDMITITMYKFQYKTLKIDTLEKMYKLNTLAMKI